MSEHREWSPQIVWHDESLTALMNEHNVTVRAYRDAMAECDRLGKANDEACDRIAELEKWRQETLDENNRLDRELDEARRALKSTIRLPFTDAQIEAMAKAADECYSESWRPTWPDAIRAALAAGGLEPCAAPEHKPEDVALRPHYLHVTRDEIASVIESFHSHKGIHTGNEADAIMALLASKATCIVNAERASDEELAVLAHNTFNGSSAATIKSIEQAVFAKSWMQTIAAVRSRVEAPLLAEIAEHRRHVGIVMSRESATRAELEALKAERDARVKDIEEYKLERERIQEQARRYKKDYHAALGEAQELRAELACKLIAKNSSEPTGWELDVTAEEVEATYYETDIGDDGMQDWAAIIDLCRSRIRPTFECKECAARREAILNPAPDAKCAMCAEWEKDCRALIAASRSIDARIAARDALEDE